MPHNLLQAALGVCPQLLLNTCKRVVCRLHPRLPLHQLLHLRHDLLCRGRPAAAAAHREHGTQVRKSLVHMHCIVQLLLPRLQNLRPRDSERARGAEHAE